MSTKKHIAILGSTGSIGTQALGVIALNPDRFELEVLTANNNVSLLIEQAKRFIPNIVIIANEDHYDYLQKELSELPIKVFAGSKDIADVVSLPSIDIVLTAMVGFSGLLPTINAIKNKKTIALANKETLVVAGDLIKQLALDFGVSIRPVDSEHSAIFQCLVGEFDNPIEKIILTASGGPFRETPFEQFDKITLAQALKHPNWSMGHKITIDSASMMNKGLEAIEAKWLFDLKPHQIEILIHPQSIVHSMVQFADGSIKAQLGLPDMRLPIQFALSYPDRLSNPFPRMNFNDYSSLNFYQPDYEKFKALKLAFIAMDKGGNVPCVMNAANEIAVDAFLKQQIKFIDIPNIVEKTMDKINFKDNNSLDDLLEFDHLARKQAFSIITENNR
ncbi:MAG: 1-deoxy-D-xylulose-5-phosphate reductoisomerase [Bacteroidales bacterium]|nr:1-deoxy-D-xylulose-5-phosphate reductoisomerase [Bacteroidales bacterium]